MRKVITFLGVRPQQTEYIYQGRIYNGQVFAEALYQFLDFDQMLVFVTKAAEANTFPVLQKFEDKRIVPILIPTGENPQEMWETFEILTNAVDEKDTVIFDITHGLRSAPFLIFLAAAFLKSAKQVTIEAIYYGAFELGKDSSGQSKPAPVIEMSEFISLLDWMNASDQFIRTGNARVLADQLRKAKPNYQLQQKDSSVRTHGLLISQAAAALDKVSRSLRLILPDRAMQASEDLQSNLGAATDAIKQWARPFSILAQQVSNAYAPLALAHPRSRQNLTSSLNRERQLVQWYLDRNLLVQAIATAREWLVTWGLIQAGYTDPYDKAIREGIIEKAFTNAIKQRKEQHGAFSNYQLDTGIRLHQIPSISKALDLYNNLGQNRNILLHAGKQPAAKTAEELEKEVLEQCKLLNELPLPVVEERENL